MTSWTIKEIAEATGGTLHHVADDQLLIKGVDFDTRKLTEGSLFVPLVANRNGHDFIENASENGACAAFWSDPVEKAPADFPIIEVENTLEAFQQLAKWHLKQVSPKVVGVTGSNGKTTTKDMIEGVLSTTYRTHKTKGNFNNQIGLPVTILEMPKDTEVAILEMGMDHAGEIHELSILAEPDVAVITMIGESHIEFFGSREGIADAKTEILDGLSPEGTLVYPADEPLLETRVDRAPNTRTFGKAEKAELYATNIETSQRATSFSVNREPELTITIPTPGEYNVQNALAALLVGEELGVSIETGAKGLSTFNLTKNRLEWLDGVNDSQVLNDAYNASPSSVKAALNYFSALENTGKKVVVLGDMLELGALSQDLHRSLAEAIHADKVDELVLYGNDMKVLYEEVRNDFDQEAVRYFSGEKQPMIDHLRKIIQPNDVVLVKSSLGTDLLHVVNELTQV